MIEEEARNFIKAWIKVLASLIYTYFIASIFPKGMYRFISLLPIFYLFTNLPLCVSRPIPSTILSGYFTWIANFKLLLYSFNLGPLSNPYPQSSFLKFFFLAAFPIAIKVNSDQSDVHNLTSNKVSDAERSNACNLSSDIGSTNKVVLPLNFWSKVLLFILLEVVYNSTKSMLVICCLMYLFIDIMFGICDLIVKIILGIKLQPPSNEPYLSTSLQDFWGNRWNCMISDILRHTVYKPTKSLAIKFVGQKLAPLPAVMGCFIVSGLMHELVYYHMTRASPTWEVTWFFVLHGVCVILEMLVKRALGRKLSIHWVVSGPLTIGFLISSGLWLFFPQIMRNHVDLRATEDILEFGKYMKEMISIG